MKLKEWIDNKKLTLEEASTLFGYKDSTMLSRVLRGKRRVSPEKALFIEQITNGELNRCDIIFPEPNNGSRHAA